MIDEGETTCAPESGCHLCAVYLSVPVMLMGSYEILARSTGLPPLSPGGATAEPLQFNTTLGLMMCALAIIASRSRRRWYAIVPAIIAATLGLLTLIEHLGGINLGIDTLLAQPLANDDSAFPGRPGPNTSLCMFLVGACLAAGMRRRRSIAATVVSLYASLLVLFLGLIAALGYLYESLQAYSFGSLSGMSPVTAVSFTLLGLAMLVRDARGSSRQELIANGARSVPISLACCLWIVSVQSWHITQESEHHANHERAAMLAQIVGEQIESMRAETQLGLIELASTLSKQSHADGAPHSDALGYLNRAYTSVSVIDHQGEIAWYTGKKAHAVDMLRLESEHPAWDNSPIATSSLLTDRGTMLIAYRPERLYPHASILVAELDLDRARRILLSRHDREDIFGVNIQYGDTRIGSESPAGIECEGCVFRTMSSTPAQGVISAWLKESAAHGNFASSPASLLSAGALLLLIAGVSITLQIRSTRIEALRTKAESKAAHLSWELTHLREAMDEHAIIAITDPKGVITYVNDQFCEISKYERNELIGQTHAIVNSGHHDKAFFTKLWRTIASGHTWKGDICNRAKDGSHYWVGTTIQPFVDESGKITRYVSIRTDITAHRLAEMEIHKMFMQLKQKNKEMEQITYTVTHDLKSPIVTIQGYNGFLREDIESGRHDRLVEFSNSIETATCRMRSILDDLLHLSGVGLARFDVEPIGMDALVEDVLRGFRPQLEAIGANVSVEPNLPEIKGDQAKIWQIFQNLIGNAIKYGVTPEDTLHLTISAQTLETGFARFTVEDRGVGIDPQYTGRVFELFQRLATDQDGTGVGLTIVKRIAERHGGDAYYEPTQGGGSTFVVVLPLNKAAHVPVPQDAA